MVMPSKVPQDVPSQDPKKSQPVATTTLAEEAPPVEISKANINGIEHSGAKTNVSAEAVSDSDTQDHADVTTLTPAMVDSGQVPATDSAQGQASITPTETQAPVAPLPLSSPEPQARGKAKHKEKNKGKDGVKPENGFVSPTLPGARPRNHGHKPSKTSASSSGNGQPKFPSFPRSPGSSFLSKLFRKLVPCVGSSPNSHPIELDGAASGIYEPSKNTKEKTATEGPERGGSDSKPPPAPPKDASVPPDRTKGSETSTSTPVAPLQPDIVPPTRVDDAEVILPPTPTHLLPKSETEGVTSGAVQPPGSTGGSALQDKSHSRDSTIPSGDGDESEGTSFTEDEDMDDPNGLDEVEDEEDRLILNGGAGIPIGPDGTPKPLLPPIAPHHVGRKCLVLDLDETLVHSSFKSIQQADYVVPVEIEYHWHNVYVIKRPGVDNFLKKMGEIYEVVVFTASLSKYADPVLDKLDIHQVVSHRLFRESCYNHKGNYVKDLSQLGRPTADTIILDNSPASYIFHPNNAVPVSSWFNDPHDTELTDLVPFLADMTTVDDVRGVLDGAR